MTPSISHKYKVANHSVTLSPMTAVCHNQKSWLVFRYFSIHDFALKVVQVSNLQLVLGTGGYQI